MTWSGDLSGAAGSAPSSADRIADTGTSCPGGAANRGTGEVESCTADPADLQQDGSGNLRIAPIRCSRGRWTSGRIETPRTDLRAAPGGKALIQARIRMPAVTGSAAAGYGPAFRTLGDAYRGDHQDRPGIGEFDVTENVNGVTSVRGTLHCGTDPGGPCNETGGPGAGTPCPATACQGAFRTHGFAWDRSTTQEALRRYVDGTLHHSATSDQTDTTTWTDATHHGRFLLLNVAMGGAVPEAFSNQPAPTRSTASGVPMPVDHVAVLNS
ncbi:1,3-beta-glucanase [Streptomyces sp. NPDC001380]|uniref:1,3-beta-glucanase n=1 Tax=Streptomyces sp. NPDC001380 TaxID=3364566 RepID=UPI0036832D8E